MFVHANGIAKKNSAGIQRHSQQNGLHRASKNHGVVKEVILMSKLKLFVGTCVVRES